MESGPKCVFFYVLKLGFFSYHNLCQAMKSKNGLRGRGKILTTGALLRQTVGILRKLRVQALWIVSPTGHTLCVASCPAVTLGETGCNMRQTERIDKVFGYTELPLMMEKLKIRN
jgi:coenzyme F420-reducing hydrogenase gamma subunit